MANIRQDEITRQIQNILSSNLAQEAKEDALKKIEESDKSGSYKEIIETANQLNYGMISKQEFDERLKLFYEQRDKQANSLRSKAMECAITELVAEEQQEHPEKTEKEIRAEIHEKLENAANIATINEMNNDNDNNATITENENEKFELGKKKEKAKLKKLYDYKVEGQITSGIKELDEFLKIIQPVINQAIIQPWKLVYGINDKFTESKDALVNWDKDRKDLKNDWKILQLMGKIDKNDNISFVNGNSDIKNIVAEKCHSTILDQMNKDIYDDLISEKTEDLEELYDKDNNFDENWSEQEKLKYETEHKEAKKNFINAGLTTYKNSKFIKNGEYKRTKVFDTTKSYEPARDAINKVFVDLIRDHCRDEKGNISDDGKKYMEGFIHIIDLFNTDNNDYIKEKYGEDLDYIMREAKKGHRFDKGFIEDEKIKEIHGNFEKKREKGQFSELTKLLEGISKEKKA